jgi:serralysin
MSEVFTIGGGNQKMTVYGNGTVMAGDGNDTITIMGWKGAVSAGNGNDDIDLKGKGVLNIGSGSDSIYFKSGTLNQVGAAGHDTITLGFGNDTIYEAGNATIHGSFGKAYADDGAIKFKDFFSGNSQETALGGNVTLIGGAYSNEFFGGAGTTLFEGGKGADTFVGGSGHETMVGGASTNLFAFLAHEAGGSHVITNFVAGQDQLYLEGHTLSYLEAHNDISVHGGNTFISLDGGSTTVELKGITSLTSSDVTTTKPV